MKVPMILTACAVAICLAIIASTDISPPGAPAGRPATVDPRSGMIIPAQPAPVSQHR